MGIYFFEKVLVDEKEKIFNFFKSMGEVIVIDEKYMDVIIVLFGSGLVFVVYFIESCVDAVVKFGFLR